MMVTSVIHVRPFAWADAESAKDATERSDASKTADIFTLTSLPNDASLKCTGGRE
jgi:hypothetical protein